MWIENTGGCPVETGTLVDVKYRDGTIEYNLAANIATDGDEYDASEYFWYLEESPNDILFWKLSEQKKEDGWIEWHGGECPVDDDTEVIVHFDGEDHNVRAGSFWDWNWRHKGKFDDITKYRIVKKDLQKVDVKSSMKTAFEKVVSNGLSSSYYQLNIKTKDGEFKAEVGDVIAAMVGDNFALGNVVKALRRIWLDSQGGGKAGVDMAYDINKCKYFLDDFQARYKRDRK